MLARKAYVVKVLRCLDCGLSFTKPIYRTWLTANFYDRVYAAEGTTTAMPSVEEAARLKSTRFRGSDKEAGARLRAIRELFPPTPAPRLLELGSSWGYFLSQAEQAGFECEGLEIGTARRLFGVQNLGVTIHSTWAEVGKAPRFDVIYTAHVLEHFTDLSAVFRELASRLRVGGKLLIEVPNFDFERFGAGVLSSVGAVHPLGFDSRFFKQNLPGYGLRVLGIHETWNDFPAGAVEASGSAVVIVHAERAE